MIINDAFVHKDVQYSVVSAQSIDVINVNDDVNECSDVYVEWSLSKKNNI